MAEERVEVRQAGLDWLQSAAADFARAEIPRIVQAVVDELRSRPAVGTFGDVAARHVWDEYCWALQEGPFDVDMGMDNPRLGSLDDAFDDVVRGSVLKEVEKLPRHAQVFLSARAFEEDDETHEEEFLGDVWVDGMVNLLLEEVKERGSHRSLSLIGPHRGDVIGFEIEGEGTVWLVLSRKGVALNLLADHVDAMIDPDGDLCDLAEAMVANFIELAKEETERGVFAEFFEPFEYDIGSLIRDRDVLPALERMRAALLRRVDE